MIYLEVIIDNIKLKITRFDGNKFLVVPIMNTVKASKNFFICKTISEIIQQIELYFAMDILHMNLSGSTKITLYNSGTEYTRFFKKIDYSSWMSSIKELLCEI